MKLILTVLKEQLSVCRLERDSDIPLWAIESKFFSITKTSDELSIVSSEENTPIGVKCEKGWRGLKIEGPLDFGLIGILSEISSILAVEKISIFAISTYDTDYILLKSNQLDNAIKALESKGYEIIK